MGVLQVALVSGVAQAQDRSFSEGFGVFDVGRWGKSDHRLGRTLLEPSNVSVRRGRLAIKLPARSYHFRYGPRSVAFYADGKFMKRWRSGIPDESMHLLVNAWYPSWLGGKSAPTNRFLLVDWIRYRQL